MAEGPVKQVHQIVIEFDGEQLRVKHPGDAILCLGMLRLAEHEITAKLEGHGKPENKGGKIVIPNFRMKGGEA